MQTVMTLLIFLFPSLGFAQGSEKFFRLEYEGRESFILATNHQTSADSLPPEITQAIKKSQQIILESDAFSENADRDRYQEVLSQTDVFLAERNHLRKHLSPGARRVYERFFRDTGRLDIYLRMKPGIAFLFAKEKFIDAVHSQIEKHFHLVDFDRDKPVMIDRRLLDAGLLVLGSPMEPNTLKLTAFSTVVEFAERQDKRGLDQMVFEEANGKPVTYLIDSEPFKNKWLEYLNLVTINDLNKALMAMKADLENKSAAEFFWNQMVGTFLSKRLDQDFFSFENKSFGRALDLVTESVSQRHFPGEETAIRYLASRHSYWVPTLLEKIKNGGAFIAVGAGHVVDVDLYAKPTLLESFKQHGITVEPVTVTGHFEPARLKADSARILCRRAHL